jgi:hypothetical protein
VRVSYEVGDGNTVKHPFRADFMHLDWRFSHGVVQILFRSTDQRRRCLFIGVKHRAVSATVTGFVEL